MIYIEGCNPELHSTGIQTSRVNPHRSKVHIELYRKLIEWERAILSAARRLTGRSQAVTPFELIAEVDRAQSPLLTLDNAFAFFLAYKQSQISLLDNTQRSPDLISPQLFESYSKRWMWVSRYLERQRNPALLLVSVDASFVQTFYYHLCQ